jgi:hypothetical protein
VIFKVFPACRKYLDVSLNSKSLSVPLMLTENKKAHCVDGRIVQRLFELDEWSYRPKPTREQCGCTESTDIGAYDTCPHGCVYCYANSNKQKARLVYNRHDVNCAFLGFTSQETANWLTDGSLNKRG